MPNKLTHRELATILAALRMFQNENDEFRSAMPHFEDVEPLDDEAIDDLCERLNFGMIVKIKT